MSSDKKLYSKNLAWSSLVGKDFRKAVTGIHPFQKILLGLFPILCVCFFAVLPVLAGGILELIVLAVESNRLIVLWSGFLVYLIALSTTVFYGFQIALISFFVSGLVFSVFAAVVLDASVSLPLIFISLGIILSSISIVFITFLVNVSFLLLGRIGKYTSIVGLAISAIALIPLMIRGPVQEISGGSVTTASSLITVSLIILVIQDVLNESGKFNWIRDKAVFWTAIGGTSFYKSDLTDACFEGADLRHTDLRKATLTRTNFKNVTGLELSRLQGTILEQPNVRKLLTSRNGYGKDFTEADLSGADLRGADLREAVLVKAQLLNADLSGACLTDACIQDWNINHNTRFNNVDCKRVYLKRSPSGHFLEPKPDSGEFGPGEFEKWITDVRDTIDLIFQNGLNWRAFAFSLTQTAINNEGIDLSVRSIENKGDGVVVAKVSVSVDTNKTLIHREITEHYDGAVAAIAAKYELVLKAKDDEIDRLVAFHETQQRFIQGLVSGIAEPKEKVLIQGEGNRVYVMNQAGDVMENSNQNINAGGNVDMSTGARVSIGGDVTGSSINLGELSGQVTNTIQQLQDIKTTDGNDLARILTQLKKSINEDQALSDAQKEQALEAVATLAEEGKKPPESRTAKFCSMAINALKGLASSVADVSKLAEMLQTSLPTLTKLLGL
jgi:uncharacterized protein YjbI with pentapeptide repeats